MRIVRAIGKVMLVIKEITYYGSELLIVRQMDCNGSLSDNGYIAVDKACAGQSDYVAIINKRAPAVWRLAILEQL